jgi:hypothetical protein
MPQWQGWHLSWRVPELLPQLLQWGLQLVSVTSTELHARDHHCVGWPMCPAQHHQSWSDVVIASFIKSKGCCVLQCQLVDFI